MVVESLAVSMYAGEHFTIPFAVVDSAGDPKDLTGLTVTFRLSVVYTGGYGGTALLEKDSDLIGGVTVDAGTGGTCDVELIDDDTTGWDPGTYHMQLEADDGTGDGPVVLATGTLTMKRRVASAS